MFGKRGGRLTALLLGLAIVVLVGWALWPKPVPIDIAVVDRGTLEVTVEDEGITRIRDVYTVSAPIGGKMLRTHQEVGDPVVAGRTIVAVIEPMDPTFLDVRTLRVNEAAVQAAQAAVDLADAQVVQARSQLDFAESDLRRAEELASRQTIAARTLEKAKLDLTSAQAAVASAIATLEVRRRELESARARLIQPGESRAQTAGCCVEVRSPIDGHVLRIVLESEQVVQPGTPLIELGDPNKLEIVVDFLSRDAVRIAPGAMAHIESWGGDARFNARVRRVEPTAFTKVSALGIEEQRVKVILDFTDPPQQWRQLGHGYRIVARVVVWRGQDVLLAPLGALFRHGDAWAVFVVSEGRAQRRLVQIGERNTRAARVIEGLQPGEFIILHPSDRIRPGVRVQARDAERKPAT